MIEVQFFIPVRDNHGKRFPPRHHRQFMQYVLEFSDGATFLPNETDGVWKSKCGTVFHDRCRLLMICVESLTTSGPQLRAIAKLAAAHYGQLAILFRYLGISELYE